MNGPQPALQMSKFGRVGISNHANATRIYVLYHQTPGSMRRSVTTVFSHPKFCPNPEFLQRKTKDCHPFFVSITSSLLWLRYCHSWAHCFCFKFFRIAATQHSCLFVPQKGTALPQLVKNQTSLILNPFFPPNPVPVSAIWLELAWIGEADTSAPSSLPSIFPFFLQNDSHRPPLLAIPSSSQFSRRQNGELRCSRSDNFTCSSYPIPTPYRYELRKLLSSSLSCHYPLPKNLNSQIPYSNRNPPPPSLHPSIPPSLPPSTPLHPPSTQSPTTTPTSTHDPNSTPIPFAHHNPRIPLPPPPSHTGVSFRFPRRRFSGNGKKTMGDLVGKVPISISIFYPNPQSRSNETQILPKREYSSPEILSLDSKCLGRGREGSCSRFWGGGGEYGGRPPRENRNRYPSTPATATVFVLGFSGKFFIQNTLGAHS